MMKHLTTILAALCMTTDFSSAFTLPSSSSSLSSSLCASIPSAVSMPQKQCTALHVGGYEMGEEQGSNTNNKIDNKNKNKNDQEEPIVLLALKMAGILAIKTVKDVFNYPPMLLDEYNRKQQAKQIPEGELPKNNPYVLLAKLVGVLAFKTVHDAVYYPALWTKQALTPKNQDDEYYY
jgi:hypothetical protein